MSKASTKPETLVGSMGIGPCPFIE